jgi:hypothetical protein
MLLFPCDFYILYYTIANKMAPITRSQSKALKDKPIVYKQVLNKTVSNKKYFVEIMKKKVQEINITNGFNRYRMIAEMCYTIREWFDIVIAVDCSFWKRFIDKFYLKVNEMLVDAYEKDTAKFTDDEYWIYETMINEMRETRKFIAPYAEK